MKYVVYYIDFTPLLALIENRYADVMRECVTSALSELFKLLPTEHRLLSMLHEERCGHYCYDQVGESFRDILRDRLCIHLSDETTICNLANYVRDIFPYDIVDRLNMCDYVYQITVRNMYSGVAVSIPAEKRCTGYELKR